MKTDTFDLIISHYPLIVSAFCAAILLFIIAALVFRPQFRRDLLSAEGEASFLKIVTIKGVALLTFVGLFAFGTIYPVWVYSEHCKDTPRVPHSIGVAIDIIDKYVQSDVPEDIRSYVEHIADDLKKSLGKLEKGTVIIFGEFAGSKPAKENLLKMPSGSIVLATHVPAKRRGLEDMHAWEDTKLRTWFNYNIDAISRGVKIHRIFILRKHDLVDPNWNCIKDRRSVDIMRKHKEAGVEVFLTWFEDIERQRDVEDSILFGDRLVQVNQSAWKKEGHNEILVSVNNRVISAYKRRWNEWRTAGRTLNEALGQYVTSNNKELLYCAGR